MEPYDPGNVPLIGAFIAFLAAVVCMAIGSSPNLQGDRNAPFVVAIALFGASGAFSLVQAGGWPF